MDAEEDGGNQHDRGQHSHRDPLERVPTVRLHEEGDKDHHDDAGLQTLSNTDKAASCQLHGDGGGVDTVCKIHYVVEPFPARPLLLGKASLGLEARQTLRRGR